MITVVDAAGKPVDWVRYSDSSPWPIAPDQLSVSLEVLDPTLDNNSPANWRTSRATRPNEPTSPAVGTPGAANSVSSVGLPPFIARDDIQHTPLRPTSSDSVRVVVSNVTSQDAVGEVSLSYETFIAPYQVATETMTVAMIPPEMCSALLGEPRMIAEDVIREMLSRDVACSSSSVSSLVLSRTQAWLYDPGELLLSESRYDPLVAIQSARLSSGKGIAIVTDGGIQRLEDVHPEQPLRGDNSLFFGLKNAEGSSTSLSFNLPAGAMCHRDFNSEGPWLGGALGSFTEGGSLPYQPKDDERKESCGSFSASSHDEEYQRKDLLHGRLSVDIAILEPVGTGAAGSAPRIARMFSS